MGHRRAVHIFDFTLVLVLTMGFHLLLIIHPLVRKDISAVHTTNGDNHDGSYLIRGKAVLSIFMGAFVRIHKSSTRDPEMTSCLYSGGLNYQQGNPVRQEIVSVRREVDSLRKLVEDLTEENLVYRKHLMKLTAEGEKGSEELVKDLTSLANSSDAKTRREAGGGTVQGGGFRR